MEQLFKCKTIKQRKIMEWMANQGITADDISEAKLSGPGLVRITNPTGQYMDIYCSDNFAVRLLQITEEREEELQWYFWNETDDPETEEWREDLTADEAAIVEQWDKRFLQGYQRLAQACLDLQSNDPNLVQEAGFEPEM